MENDRKSIAAALRKVADDLWLDKIDQTSAEGVAGQFLIHAFNAGVFSEPRWMVFKAYVLQMLAHPPAPNHGNAFCNAVYWLELHRDEIPIPIPWNIPTTAWVNDGAPFIADLIGLAPSTPTKDADYMPAEWFQSLYGIRPDRLRQAKKRGKLASRKINGRIHYSVTDARRLWPEDVTDGRD